MLNYAEEHVFIQYSTTITTPAIKINSDCSKSMCIHNIYVHHTRHILKSYINTKWSFTINR